MIKTSFTKLTVELVIIMIIMKKVFEDELLIKN